MAVEITPLQFNNETLITFPYANMINMEDPGANPPPYVVTWVEQPHPSMTIQSDEPASFSFSTFDWATQYGDQVGIRYRIIVEGIPAGTYTGSFLITVNDIEANQHEFGPVPATIVINEEFPFEPADDKVTFVALGRVEFQNHTRPPVMLSLGHYYDPDLEEWTGEEFVYPLTVPTVAPDLVDTFNSNILTSVSSANYEAIITGNIRGEAWRTPVNPNDVCVNIARFPYPNLTPNPNPLSAVSRGQVWRAGDAFNYEAVKAIYPNILSFQSVQAGTVTEVNTIPDVEILKGMDAYDTSRAGRLRNPTRLIFCCRAGKLVVVTDPLDLSTHTVKDLSADNGGADFRGVHYLSDIVNVGAPSTLIAMAISEDGSVFRSTDNADTFTQLGAGPILGSGYGIDVCRIGTTGAAMRYVICGGPDGGGQNMIAYSDDYGSSWTEVPPPALPAGYSSWIALYDVSCTINNPLTQFTGEGEPFVVFVGSMMSDAGDETGVIIRTTSALSVFEVVPIPYLARVENIMKMDSVR
jgi:hypothetical protein